MNVFRWLFLLAILCTPWCAAQSRISTGGAEPGGANLPAQRVGPNDLIAVSVYDSAELTRTIRISSEGEIRLPMVKRRIRAAGLLPAELESAIAEALDAEGILVSPVVTVTVVEYQSRPISVAGAVKNPITFQATGTVTLLEAITRAGGLSPEAGLEVLVSRGGLAAGESRDAVRRIPVKSLIDDAAAEANIRLVGGEEIRVPEISKVFIVGNIKKPGSYPLRDASETTVLKMLAVAEGLTPYASKQAYIIRKDERSGAKHEIPVELKNILRRKAADVSLMAGDILYVPDNSGRRASMAALERITGFGASTASGVIIWGRPR